MGEHRKAGCASLIMAGGSGTRFWPWSRKSHPKQYLNLVGGRSLIQLTAERVLPMTPWHDIYVCSTAPQKDLLKKQLPQLTNVLLEPLGKNTAPCLMLSTIALLRDGYAPDTVMMVFPADHYVPDVEVFRKTLAEAVEAATRTEGLVTLGIVPAYAHTGYGYIEAGAKDPASPHLLKVKRFVEKPNREKAEGFLKNGGFYWNSGIFIWTLGAIAKAFETYMPSEWKAISSAYQTNELARVYSTLPSTAIDVGVLEKASNVYVIPSQFGWSDVGSWNSLYELHCKKPGDNVILSGNVTLNKSEGCLVQVEGDEKIALVGLKNMIVVKSGGTWLIADREQDQAVREVATKLDP